MNQPLTKTFIRNLIETNDRALSRAVVVIYERQTLEEQISELTQEHNGKGFTSFDAEILSSFAKQIQAGRTLSPKQISLARKKMIKYSSQLLIVAQAKAQIN